MDKQQVIDSDFELIDFIFISIKIAKRATIQNLFETNKENLKKMGVDLPLFNAIIQAMVQSGKVLSIGDGTYMANPLIPGFLTFKHEYLLSESKKKQEKRRDFWLRVLPIVFSVLFGIIAAIVSFANLNLSISKKQDTSKSKSTKMCNNCLSDFIPKK